MLLAQILHYHDLFVVGGIWFWVLLAASFAAVTILTEWDRTVSAFFVVLAGLGVLQVLSNADWVGYLWHHPQWAIPAAIGYFFLGLGTSLAKWRSYCHDQNDKYTETKEAWLEGKGLTGTKIPENLLDAWEKYLKEKENRYGRCIISGMDMTLAEIKAGKGPSFRNNKARCLTWASYWPCTLFWMLLNNPLRRLFNQAINMLRGVYEDIAANAFKDVGDDFRKTVPGKGEDRVALGPDGTAFKNEPEPAGKGK